MDPLIVLRDYVSTGKLASVTVEGDRVNFGDQYSFSKSQLTSFKSKQKDELLPLHVVLFFIQHIGQGAQEYVKQASSQGVPSVFIQDRKVLREYLEGVIDADQVPQIVDSVPALLPVAAEEPAAKKARLEDDEADVLKLLAQQERQLRDRNTMLLAPNRTFEKVLSILDRALAAEKARAAKAAASLRSTQQHAAKAATAQQRPQSQQQQAPQPQRPAQPAGGMAFMKPSGRYERDVAPDALRAMAGGAANLVAGLVYAEGPRMAPHLPVAAGAALAPHLRPPAAQPPAPPQQQPLAQRPAPPAAPQRPASSSQQQRSGGGGDSHRHRPSSSGSSKSRSGGSGSGKPGGQVPIILVPGGAAAMVNMYNAKAFLEKGQFVPSSEAMAANPVKPSSVTIMRPARPGRPAVPYVVTDRVPSKSSSDWKRVVAVICQGKAWQFKDFPFKGAEAGNLVDTLSRMVGLYVHYRNETVPDTVKGWRVTYVALEREGRHLDRSAQIDLFAAIDKFLGMRRSDLAY